MFIYIYIYIYIYIAIVYFKTIDMGCILLIKYFGVLCQIGTDGEVHGLRVGHMCMFKSNILLAQQHFANNFSHVTQLKLSINGFRLLCDRMAKFRVPH